MNLHIVMAGLLAPVALVAMWVAILHVIALVGGWSALSRHYAASAPFRGTTVSGQNGWVGIMGYGWSLTVGGDERGFHMSVMRPFRPGQPPLFAPWEDVEVAVGETLFGLVADLRLRKVPRVRIRLPPSTARAIARASRGRLELPAPLGEA